MSGTHKLVPVEATWEMLRAGQRAWLADPERKSSTLYRAMVAAAPGAAVEDDQRQGDVGEWAAKTFGIELSMDVGERVDRVFEEAAELAQAEGRTQERMARILAHVFSRPAGNTVQEAAGVAVTLLAYGDAKGISIRAVEADEIARIALLPAEHFRARQSEKAAAGVALPPTPED